MKKNTASKIGFASILFFLLFTMACEKKTADVEVKKTADVEPILDVDEKWTGDFDGMV